MSKNKKADYRGKAAAEAQKGKDKIRCYGVVADCNKVVVADTELFQGETKVGDVIQPALSPFLKQSTGTCANRPIIGEAGRSVLNTGVDDNLPSDDPWSSIL